LEVAKAVVAVPAGATTAAYFDLTNDGSTPDRLVEVRADTGPAEVHRTVQDGERMSMEPVSELVIDGGEVVSFEPGGLHIMLLEVGALESGDMVTITLEFESAEELEFEARVVPYSEIEP
jgi:copper(I)-binding protein